MPWTALEVELMLTEFEVRQRIESIRAARSAPLRKARLLLRIGRSLSAQEQALHRAKEQIARTSDRKAEAGIGRLESHTHQLHEDVLDAAFEALQTEPMRLATH